MTTNQTHEYHHTFKDGTRSKLTLSPTSFDCEWSGKPDRRTLGEYLAWRDACVAEFTQLTGLRILVVTL